MFLGAFALALGTAVLLTLIVQLGAIWRARASVMREDEYRRLANEAVTAGTASAAGSKLVADELTSIGQRLGAIEKLLREVG
jgi:hypothetical protein